MKSAATIGVLIMLVFVCAIFACGVFIFGFPIETGRGIHTGYVTSVERSGLVFKTWRAYVKTDTQSSQEDEYCIDKNNPKLIEALQEASRLQSHVTVMYVEYVGFGITQCGGENDMIISFESATSTSI